jgi:hypothetical protein
MGFQLAHNVTLAQQQQQPAPQQQPVLHSQPPAAQSQPPGLQPEGARKSGHLPSSRDLPVPQQLVDLCLVL